MKHVVRARLFNRLREFSPTDTNMTSIFVHSIENNLTKVKGHHLFWLFTGSSIRCSELTDDINNLINFTHIR